MKTTLAITLTAFALASQAPGPAEKEPVTDECVCILMKIPGPGNWLVSPDDWGTFGVCPTEGDDCLPATSGCSLDALVAYLPPTPPTCPDANRLYDWQVISSGSGGQFAGDEYKFKDQPIECGDGITVTIFCMPVGATVASISFFCFDCMPW